jgi:hypothetical protein
MTNMTRMKTTHDIVKKWKRAQSHEKVYFKYSRSCSRKVSANLTKIETWTVLMNHNKSLHHMKLEKDSILSIIQNTVWSNKGYHRPILFLCTIFFSAMVIWAHTFSDAYIVEVCQLPIL